MLLKKKVLNYMAVYKNSNLIIILLFFKRWWLKIIVIIINRNVNRIKFKSWFKLNKIW